MSRYHLFQVGKNPPSLDVGRFNLLLALPWVSAKEQPKPRLLILLVFSKNLLCLFLSAETL